MFPNKAQSQPADYPAMPAVPIRAADSTMQSKCPADGRGVVKRSAAYLGNHKQVRSYPTGLSLHLAR